MTSHARKTVASRLIKVALFISLVAALIWSLAPHDPNLLTDQLRSAVAADRNRDPDRPGVISGLIDEAAYLRLRGD